MGSIWDRFRHRRHKKKKRGNSCDGCDACDCDVCGCDPFLMYIPLLRTVPAVLHARPTPTLPGRLGLAAIRGYQRGLSPRLPFRCRYTPSCSEYGAQAVKRYGLVVGSRLIAARIRRCQCDVPLGTPDPLR